MSTADNKKILLNLEAEMYEAVKRSADDHSLSVTEWLRRAIRDRLEGAAPAQTQPLFEYVQTSDNVVCHLTYSRPAREHTGSSDKPDSGGNK